MAAAWPTVADVKLLLGQTSSGKDALYTAAVGAAIEKVAYDLGYVQIEVSESAGVYTLEAVPWADAYDAAVAGDDEPTPAEITPDYGMAGAAQLLAVEVLKAPEAPYGVAAVFDTGGLQVAAQHPTYLQMLHGRHIAHGFG